MENVITVEHDVTTLYREGKVVITTVQRQAIAYHLIIDQW
jgi:hypothetical protein